MHFCIVQSHEMIGMKNKDGVLVGLVVGVAVAAYFIAKKKGKRPCGKNKVAKKFNQFSDEVRTEFRDARSQVKETVADKVFDFAVANRQSIAQVAGYVMPYILKNFVKKKL